MTYHIVLVGLLGSGKTSLARIMEKEAGIKVFLEEHETKTYHVDFAKNISKWAFHNQVDFILTAAKIQKNISTENQIACQDGCMYEYFNVFTRYLYDSKYLVERDYRTLENLFTLLDEVSRPPDLLIFLETPPAVALSRIKHRMRVSDKTFGVDLDFLNKINAKMHEWINTWSYSEVLRIDTEGSDFVNDLSARHDIIQKVIICSKSGQ